MLENVEFICQVPLYSVKSEFVCPLNNVKVDSNFCLGCNYCKVHIRGIGSVTLPSRIELFVECTA